MAILALFTSSTISPDDYQALRDKVGWEVSNPPGGIFHVAAFDEGGGLHVADVWDSPEALDAFVNERLGPAMAELGITPPDVAVHPAVNVNAYRGALEPYSLG